MTTLNQLRNDTIQMLASPSASAYEVERSKVRMLLAISMQLDHLIEEVTAAGSALDSCSTEIYSVNRTIDKMK